MKQPLVHHRQNKPKEKLRESDSNKKETWEINLCMVSTHNKVNKLMFIKQTPISGFLVWVWKLKQGFIMILLDQSLDTRNYKNE